MKRVSRSALRIVTLVVFAGLVASGCTVVGSVGFYWDLWRANRAGERFYNTYEHIGRNVGFTDISEVRLDIYSPPTGTGHPVLIFVHGGGWDKYDKELFAPVAMQLVPRDIVVVIPDYTLYPDATYEQMTRETAAAVAWTFAHAEEYRGDPQRIVLSGHSAGGHLSGLVAFDPTWLAEFGFSPTDLCGWIGLSGVYDVNAQMAFERATGSTAPVMTAVMKGEATFTAASPITHVGPGSVDRAWLIHGVDDETVPVTMSEAMARRLEAAGIATDLALYPEAGHSGFLFEALSNDDARVLRDISGAVSGCD